MHRQDPAVAATVAVAAQPASAQDLVAGPALAQAAGDIWTGVHIGGGIGAAAFNSRWTTDCLASVALPATCPNDMFGGATRVGNDNPADFDPSGIRLNFYLGLDWQASSWLVVGIEGEVAKLKDSVRSADWNSRYLADRLRPWPEHRADRERMVDASLRGRVGFLLTPRTLIYSTGGLAILREEVSAGCGDSFPVGWCAVAGRQFKVRDRLSAGQRAAASSE